MTDKELLERYCRGGDPSALCELARRHTAMVRSAALRELRDEHLADDVTQAVFLVLMRRARSLPSDVVLGGWLFKAAVFAARDARKLRKRREAHEREAALMKTPGDAVSEQLAEETRAMLNGALEALSDGDRDALVLRYLEGQSTGAVAAALGTSENTARQRISRALERLRKSLRKRHVLLAAGALLAILEAPAEAAADPAELGKMIESMLRQQTMPSLGIKVLSEGVIAMQRQEKIHKALLLTAAVAAAAMLFFMVPVALSQTPPRPPAAAPVAGAAAALTQAAPEAAPAPSSPADPAMAATAINSFAMDVYQKVSGANVGKNVFISPYSLASALAMTAEGARGNTSTEMLATLHIPPASVSNQAGLAHLQSYHTSLAKLSGNLTGEVPADQASRGLVQGPARRGPGGVVAEAPAAPTGNVRVFELNVANNIWYEQTVPALPAFTDAMERLYKGQIVPMDFKKAPEASRKTINDQIAMQTKDKIKNLIPPPPPESINPNTRLVLTNAIYFNGSWMYPFMENQTQTAAFHVDATHEVQTPLMMQRQGAFDYSQEADLQVLMLPYAGNVLSMMLIVPTAADGLAAVERTLTAERWNTLAGNAKPRRGLIVYLPKFTMTCSYGMADSLKALGMHDPFDSGKADFSGMSKEKLFISAVIHKCFVDVDEVGTRAAGATAVVMGRGGAPSTPPTVRADHPFLFAIRENATGAILFMGRVVNPKE